MMNKKKVYDKETLKKLHRIQIELLQIVDTICMKNNLKYSTAFGTVLGAIRHKGFIPWDDDIDIIMPKKDYDQLIEILKKECPKGYYLLMPDDNIAYISLVTKFVKDGTLFIPEIEKQMKCKRGIGLDIFPLNNVADNEIERKRQFRDAWFWGRIMFLRGIAKPDIPYKGIKKKVAEFACYCVHYALVLFHVKQPYILKKYLDAVTRYNHIDTEKVTSFEDANFENNIIELNQIFPCARVPFEDIMINVPKDYEEYLINIYGDYMVLPPIEKRKNHYPYILEFGD